MPNNCFNRTAPFVTVCAARFARLRTNRANPLRGTGLPVKQMLGSRLRRLKRGKMNNRKGNEFSNKVRLKLAQRVAYHCSFPKCNKLTVGPVISNNDDVNIVGRACHIEAASNGGPRFNPELTSEERRSIDNGIWCCNSHADIIDNDLNTFSVSTLREWKKIAKTNTYREIDTSFTRINNPTTLVQVSDNVIFEGVWYNLNIENSYISFLIKNFTYGNLDELKKFISNYTNLRIAQKYVVIESSGYGRQLKNKPEIETFDEEIVISFTIIERTEYVNPEHIMDAHLVFTDEGTDIDTNTDDGWIKGKDATIQTIQLLLGSNRGQWALDESFGSYLYKYYKDHHKNHELLGRLIKLEISRMSSIPEDADFEKSKMSIPIPTINWVENVIIIGHSRNLLEIDLKLYFTDSVYFQRRISVPASL